MADRSGATSPEVRDGFKFRGGHPALDLAATLAARLKDPPRELLGQPTDLSRWLVAAGLSARPVEVTVEELAQARELREAIYRLASARVRGGEAAAADVAVLNRWAAEPPPVPQLGRDGMFWIRGGVRALLASLARETVHLLGSEAGDRIHACSGPGCAILFLDASRAGDRRWCSMAACGNRAKVAEFRRRRRDAKASS